MKSAIFIAIATTTLSVLTFAYTAQPHLWVGVVWLIGLLAAAWLTRRTYRRIVLINLAAVIVALVAYDVYWDMRNNRSLRATIASAHDNGPFKGTALDDVFGYRRLPNFTRNEDRTIRGEKIFDVTYTTNEHGLRISPPDVGGGDIDCILFFGGSVTFGLGLEDHETVPFQVGLKLGGRVRVHNFAIGGYGAHQMLAALESTFLGEVVDCRPIAIIANVGRDHARRVGGRANWDRRGPRYKIDVAGNAVRAGNFNDPLESGFDRHEIFRRLEKSIAYRKLFRGLRGEREIDLLIAIVDTSRRLAEATYPDSTFHVIYESNVDDDRSQQLLRAFRERGVPVHTYADISPEDDLRGPRYRVHEKDGHPSAFANGVIAAYVIDRIIGTAMPK